VAVDSLKHAARAFGWINGVHALTGKLALFGDTASSTAVWAVGITIHAVSFRLARY
jgi:hypothetical protein